MKDSQMYFCLDQRGELWILGEHGDFEAAEDTAKSMGLDPFWIADEETANQWRRTLTSPEAA